MLEPDPSGINSVGYRLVYGTIKRETKGIWGKIELLVGKFELLVGKFSCQWVNFSYHKISLFPSSGFGKNVKSGRTKLKKMSPGSPSITLFKHFLSSFSPLFCPFFRPRFQLLFWLLFQPLFSLFFTYFMLIFLTTFLPIVSLIV